MGKVYEGQVGVRVELETNADLTGVTLVEIRYKMGAVKGSWPATIDGTKIFFVTAAASDLAKRGEVVVQAHVVGPGFDLLGETASFKVWAPWR